MKFNEYQKFTSDTAIYPTAIGKEYLALGLAGEAGEYANKIKKILRGDKELNSQTVEELVNELGDILWYISQSALVLGVELEDVAIKNKTKLLIRLKRETLKGSGDNR